MQNTSGDDFHARTLIFTIALGLLIPLGFAAARDKTKEEKILNKTIGEWITILRTHENEKFRRAALIALEYGRQAHLSGRAALLEAVEKDKSPTVRREAGGADRQARTGRLQAGYQGPRHRAAERQVRRGAGSCGHRDRQ